MKRSIASKTGMVLYMREKVLQKIVYFKEFLSMTWKEEEYAALKKEFNFWAWQRLLKLISLKNSMFCWRKDHKVEHCQNRFVAFVVDTANRLWRHLVRRIYCKGCLALHHIKSTIAFVKVAEDSLASDQARGSPCRAMFFVISKMTQNCIHESSLRRFIGLYLLCAISLGTFDITSRSSVSRSMIYLSKDYVNFWVNFTHVQGGL